MEDERSAPSSSVQTESHPKRSSLSILSAAAFHFIFPSLSVWTVFEGWERRKFPCIIIIFLFQVHTPECVEEWNEAKCSSSCARKRERDRESKERKVAEEEEKTRCEEEKTRCKEEAESVACLNKLPNREIFRSVRILDHKEFCVPCFLCPVLSPKQHKRSLTHLGFSSPRKRASFSRNQSYDWSLSNEDRSLFLWVFFSRRQSFLCHVFLLPGISSSLLSHLSLVIQLSVSEWERSWQFSDRLQNRAKLTDLHETEEVLLLQSLWKFTAKPKVDSKHALNALLFMNRIQSKSKTKGNSTPQVFSWHFYPVWRMVMRWSTQSSWHSSQTKRKTHSQSKENHTTYILTYIAWQDKETNWMTRAKTREVRIGYTFFVITIRYAKGDSTGDSCSLLKHKLSFSNSRCYLMLSLLLVSHMNLYDSQTV